jgi:DNA polymerase III delta subunit
MIISISGDDKIKIGDFISQHKTKFPKDSIYNLDKNSDYRLDNLVDSQGLFSEKKLITVSNPKYYEILEDEEWLKRINKNADIVLLVDMSSLNGNLKIFKNIKKNAEKHLEFALPRDYTFFNLCDALFLKKDKAEAIRIIDSIEDLEEKFLPLLAIMQGSLRNFVSLKYKNKSSAGIHPFMAKKISTYKLTDDEVKNLYSKLLEMDLKSKTRKVDKKSLLIDFVLYFF